MTQWRRFRYFYLTCLSISLTATALIVFQGCGEDSGKSRQKKQVITPASKATPEKPAPQKPGESGQASSTPPAKTPPPSPPASPATQTAVMGNYSWKQTLCTTPQGESYVGLVPDEKDKFSLSIKEKEITFSDVYHYGCSVTTSYQLVAFTADYLLVKDRRISVSGSLNPLDEPSDTELDCKNIIQLPEDYGDASTSGSDSRNWFYRYKLDPKDMKRLLLTSGPGAWCGAAEEDQDEYVRQ